MPVIIDANRASDFTKPLSDHAAEILKRIAAKQMTVAVGGRLLDELSKTKLCNLLAEWARSGRLRRPDTSQLEAETKRFEAEAIKSDDPHILALALVSGTRLLYTEDQLLILDFKNLDHIRPKGKIVKPDTKSGIAGKLFDNYGK